MAELYQPFGLAISLILQEQILLRTMAGIASQILSLRWHRWGWHASGASLYSGHCISVMCIPLGLALIAFDSYPLACTR